MSLLKDILQYKPNTWEPYNYDDVRFARIPLSRESTEFSEIQEEFLQKFGRNHTVAEIERIQHPFAYGSFQIRKAHLQMLHKSIPQVNKNYCCLLYKTMNIF